MARGSATITGTQRRSASAGARLGVDIGGTKVLGVRLGAHDQVEAERKVPTPRTAPAIIDCLLAVLSELQGSKPATTVGVGSPGMVNRDGELRFSPHLPGLVGVALAAELEGRLPGTRVRVANDATCASWGEHRLGAGRGDRDLLMITLGTGIGGGVISGGQLLEGKHGFAGEFGHVVVDPHGPPCPCGKQGCWERFASGEGLGRLGREAAIAGQVPQVVARAGGDPEAVKGEHVTAAAAEGDLGAQSVMARFAWWLALGLANLANIFDPGCIVLGGGLIESGDVLITPTRAAFAELVEAYEERHGIRILPAALGERAGAIGAALLAADRSLTRS